MAGARRAVACRRGGCGRRRIVGAGGAGGADAGGGFVRQAISSMSWFIPLSPASPSGSTGSDRARTSSRGRRQVKCSATGGGQASQRAWTTFGRPGGGRLSAQGYLDHRCSCFRARGLSALPARSAWCEPLPTISGSPVTWREAFDVEEDRGEGRYRPGLEGIPAASRPRRRCLDAGRRRPRRDPRSRTRVGVDDENPGQTALTRDLRASARASDRVRKRSASLRRA